MALPSLKSKRSNSSKKKTTTKGPSSKKSSSKKSSSSKSSSSKSSSSPVLSSQSEPKSILKSPSLGSHSSSESSLRDILNSLSVTRRSIESKKKIKECDFITLNIQLSDLRNELETFCTKSGGLYNSELNKCSINITKQLSNLIRVILKTVPYNQRSADMRTAFLSETPIMFYREKPSFSDVY